LYYFCVNHKTTKTSEKIDNKGNKKRINICDSRIYYIKNRDIYLFLQDQSKEWNNLVKEISTNILEANQRKKIEIMLELLERKSCCVKEKIKKPVGRPKKVKDDNKNKNNMDIRKFIKHD